MADGVSKPKVKTNPLTPTSSQSPSRNDSNARLPTVRTPQPQLASRPQITQSNPYRQNQSLQRRYETAGVSQSVSTTHQTPVASKSSSSGNSPSIQPSQISYQYEKKAQETATSQPGNTSSVRGDSIPSSPASTTTAQDYRKETQGEVRQNTQINSQTSSPVPIISKALSTPGTPELHQPKRSQSPQNQPGMVNPKPYTSQQPAKTALDTRKSIESTKSRTQSTARQSTSGASSQKKKNKKKKKKLKRKKSVSHHQSIFDHKRSNSMKLEEPSKSGTSGTQSRKMPSMKNSASSTFSPQGSVDGYANVHKKESVKFDFQISESVESGVPSTPSTGVGVVMIPIDKTKELDWKHDGESYPRPILRTSHFDDIAVKKHRSRASRMSSVIRPGLFLASNSGIIIRRRLCTSKCISIIVAFLIVMVVLGVFIGVLHALLYG